MPIDKVPQSIEVNLPTANTSES